jgi:predicted nucleic acid-binding protein
LLASIGQFAQFRVVIDANFVIRDLLQKIKYPGRGRTALEEVVRAGVLEVYAPRWLETDLTSAIQQVAKRRNVAEADLWSTWRDYQALIKWDETWDSPPQEFEPTDDPKDLPYVNLEDMVKAIGVLSNDRDIERMGGNRLTLDFVFATRDYARTAVVSVGIRVSGRFVGAMAIESLVRIVNAVKSSLERLPPRWKSVLLCVTVFVFLHPNSRLWLTERLRKLGPIVSAVIDIVLELTSLEAQKREDAKVHLTNVRAAARQPLTPVDSDSVLMEAQTTNGDACGV